MPGPIGARLARTRASHRFTVPHLGFWCDTEDGVRLAGSILGDRSSSTAVVFAHGFMGYRTKPKFRLMAESLGRRYTVFAFDLRGHGRSGGECTGGDREALDVEAVVRAARERGYDKVVTVGASLGGIAVIRHAGLFRNVDGVVAISTPARWGGTSKPVRRITWLFATRMGRRIARELGVKLGTEWGDPKPPEEVVENVAPIPLLLVHGDDDHFFPPSEAQRLFDAAREPKELLVLPGFGHAEDGFTPAFAERLAKEIEAFGRVADAS